MTFREGVPKWAVSWRTEGLSTLRKHATRARKAADGLQTHTAYRSLVQVVAIAYEEAVVAFDAAWEREMALRPELLTGEDPR